MTPKAPRRLSHLWRVSARGALIAIGLWLAGTTFAAACSPQLPDYGVTGRSTETVFSNRTPQGRHEHQEPRNAKLILHAGFAEATDVYGHGVLGALRDMTGLTIHVRRDGSDRISCPAEIRLDPELVFEDVAPRIIDLTGDGLPEIIVVQSHLQKGAQLAVYDRRANLVATTPFIGTRFRWLAPLGAADLDGDGFAELAYIDRPHLAKTLRIWRFRNGELAPVAHKTGLTNHRIGEDFISGGIRDCGQGPQIVTVNSDWSRVVLSTLHNGEIESQDIAPFPGRKGLAHIVACE